MRALLLASVMLVPAIAVAQEVPAIVQASGTLFTASPPWIRPRLIEARSNSSEAKTLSSISGGTTKAFNSSSGDF